MPFKARCMGIRARNEDKFNPIMFAEQFGERLNESESMIQSSIKKDKRKLLRK